MVATTKAHTEYRIFGPPGTGKTTRLSGLIARAAESKGSDRVLVASFTRAAAAELVSRNLPVERANVGTLHALCFRQLGGPVIADSHVREFNKAQSHYELSDSNPDLDEPASEREHVTDADALLAELSIARNTLQPRHTWPLRLRAFAEAWEGWKEERGYLDFTDLIERCYALRLPPPGAPAVGFFDEVQDFTPLELGLVRAWAEHLEYAVLAGDDDQCIYDFKGASPNAFLAGTPDQKVILDQSYRVPRAVHTLAQAWIERVSTREPKVYRPRDDDGDVRRLRAVTWQDPDALLWDIEHELTEGRSVMLLTSCAYMLKPLMAVLRHEGIPFHNPYRRKAKSWNPLHASHGTSGAARVLALLRPDPDTWGAEARFWASPEIKAVAGALKKQGVIRKGGAARLEALAGMDELSVDALLGIFEETALSRLLDMDVGLFEDHALADKVAGLEFPIQVARRRGGAALRTPPRVTVGTIHSVKGGEADTVYLFPDLSMRGREAWDSGGRDAIRRQFYVGMTRARHNLVICAPASPRRAVPL